MDIRRAAEILRAGGLVAFATETVYGLGADATNSSAVRKIYWVKGRPATNPLIVHVPDSVVAREYTLSWPETAERLARAFWPGPLTMVLAKGSRIVAEVTAGLGTVAIRCPDHAVALELLREFGGAVAAPSANRSARISPTTAEHVRRELGDRVDLILDGGPCRVGIESTVIDLSGPGARILRPGAIGREQLEKIIGRVEMGAQTVAESAPASSPGQQSVHYSPETAAFRVSERDAEHFSILFSRQIARKAVFLIIEKTDLGRALGPWTGTGTVLEMPSSAEEYARRLYAALHEADELGAEVIWIQEPPEGAEWDAVRDRVGRAARPANEVLGQA